MRAVVIEKPGKINIQEQPKPEINENEVLVKPILGGICGTDVHVYEGTFIGLYPIIPCHEFTGEIVEVGKNVKTLKPGDNVIIDPNVRCGICEACKTGKLNVCENSLGIGTVLHGGFADFFKVPETNAYKFERCSHETAAFAEPLACVLYGQTRVEFTPGQSVIIWGAGAIGLLHLLACKNIHGCSDITVVDLDDKKLALAKKLGADHAVKVSSDLDNKLLEINPRKWDIAIDATGSVKAVTSLFKHLGRGGQALLFSVYNKNDQLSISPFDIFLNDWRIYGSLTYNHDFRSAVKTLDNGLINPEPLIDREIKLDEVPSIIEEIAGGKNMGKVQVVINE